MNKNIVDVHIKNDVVGFSEIQKLLRILNQVLKDKNEDWYRYVIHCGFSIVNDAVIDRKVHIDVRQIKTKEKITEETGASLVVDRDFFDEIDRLFVVRNKYMFVEDYAESAWEYGSRTMLLGVAREKIIWLTEQEKIIPVLRTLVKGIKGEKS